MNADILDNSNTDLRIGTQFTSNSSNALAEFDGKIDDLRISKGIARWTSNFTPPTAPIATDSYTKLLLPFDGDASASNHSVTFNGDADMGATTGEFAGSYYFDGAGDYLSIPDSENWNFGS